jgi:hypothetical protein
MSWTDRRWYPIGYEPPSSGPSDLPDDTVNQPGGDLGGGGGIATMVSVGGLSSRRPTGDPAALRTAAKLSIWV